MLLAIYNHCHISCLLIILTDCHEALGRQMPSEHPAVHSDKLLYCLDLWLTATVFLQSVKVAFFILESLLKATKCNSNCTENYKFGIVLFSYQLQC